MTLLNDQEQNWVATVLGRLRLIQADAVEMAAEQRKGLLQEELARNLKTVQAGNQKRFLQALAERNPVGGQIPKVSGAPVVQAAPVPVAAAPETPEEVIEKFFAIVSKLPEEKRSDLGRRLLEIGLVNTKDLVAEVSEESREKLGIPEEQQPRLSKIVELAALLVEMVAALDSAALGAMRELNAKSKLLRRPEDFRTASARFLTGGEPMENYLRAVAGLTGGMLTAVLGGGKDFGRQYVEQLSPTAIEDVIRGEGTKFMGPNIKERCWERYKELSDDFATPDLINRKVKDCMAAIVEKPAR